MVLGPIGAYFGGTFGLAIVVVAVSVMLVLLSWMVQRIEIDEEGLTVTRLMPFTKPRRMRRAHVEDVKAIGDHTPGAPDAPPRIVLIIDKRKPEWVFMAGTRDAAQLWAALEQLRAE